MYRFFLSKLNLCILPVCSIDALFNIFHITVLTLSSLIVYLFPLTNCTFMASNLFIIQLSLSALLIIEYVFTSFCDFSMTQNSQSSGIFLIAFNLASLFASMSIACCLLLMMMSYSWISCMLLTLIYSLICCSLFFDHDICLMLSRSTPYSNVCLSVMHNIMLSISSFVVSMQFSSYAVNVIPSFCII